MFNIIKIILESKNLVFSEAVSDLVAEESWLELEHIVPSNDYRDASLKDFEGVLLLDDIFDQSALDFRCERLVENSVSCPVIFLVDKKVKADFAHTDPSRWSIVKKPLRIDVLLSTIRTIVSKFKDFEDTLTLCGRCTLRPKSGVFTNSNGKSVKLTDKEIKIVRFLYKSYGLAISKEKLLKNVWGYSEKITTHTLETHIYRLRQKIEVNPQKPSIILTTVKGYHLCQEQKER